MKGHNTDGMNSSYFNGKKHSSMFPLHVILFNSLNNASLNKTVETSP